MYKNIFLTANHIHFTTDNLEVIEKSDIIFTLVLTPSLENGSYDVSNVDDVVSDILKYGWNKDLSNKSLVIGCTTNPGDCDFFQDRLKETGMVYSIIQSLLLKDLSLKIFRMLIWFYLEEMVNIKET